MPTTDYIVNCGFAAIRVRANLAEASAPILIIDEDDDGDEATTPTGYQTADARHRVADMARLAVRSMGRDWYADPVVADDDSDAHIDSLIKSVREA